MKKLLSILSVLTITGTSLPSAIAASNYEKENTETKSKNYYEIGIQNLENELNNYHKLNNEQQEWLKYLIENKENIISKIGEKEFEKKLRLNRKYINTYINHITILTNEIKKSKKFDWKSNK